MKVGDREKALFGPEQNPRRVGDELRVRNRDHAGRVNGAAVRLDLGLDSGSGGLHEVPAQRFLLSPPTDVSSRRPASPSTIRRPLSSSFHLCADFNVVRNASSVFIIDWVHIFLVVAIAPTSNWSSVTLAPAVQLLQPALPEL